MGMPQNWVVLEQDFHLDPKSDKLSAPKNPSNRSPELRPSKDSQIPTLKLIHFILLGAKLTIAKAWKQPKV